MSVHPAIAATTSRTGCRSLAALSLPILISLLLLIPATSWAAIALDQSSAEEYCDNCGSTTKATNFTVLPAVGSFVVGCINGNDFSGDDIDFISSVADNQGNGAYTLIKKAPVAGGSATSAIAYKENVASSGTFTVTVTTTNSTLLNYTVRWLSFTGMATSSSADVNQTGGADGSQVALSITTAATNQADELVVACAAIRGDGTDLNKNIVQNTGGYTNFIVEQDDTVRVGNIGDYKIIAATGAQNTNWGFDATTGSGSTAGVIGTFKAAAAGGGSAGRGLLLGVGP